VNVVGNSTKIVLERGDLLTEIVSESDSQEDAMISLVDNVITRQFHDLPPKAILATKTFILDSFGVGLAGSLAPGVSELLKILLDWRGTTESTVLGFGELLPSWGAAMMNSFLMHNQEFDCVHDRAVLHPFTIVLPTTLAISECSGRVNGTDFILANALGVDVACSLGLASRAPMTHFRPGTAGAFGAVAAAAKLLKFDKPTLLNAMGIVYSQICGTLQPHHEGAAINSMQTGFNARAAVTAIFLAAAGIEGPHNVLEGPYGYLRIYEGNYDTREILEELGKEWHVEGVSHKPYPCGRLTHSAVDAALFLRGRHSIRPEDVEELVVVVPPLVHRLVGRHFSDIRITPQYAKLSIPYVVAVAMIRGKVNLSDFSADVLSDSVVGSLAKRVKVILDDGNMDENAMGPVDLRIRMENGIEYSMKVPHALGSPGYPLTRSQQLEKFRYCWSIGAMSLPSINCNRVIDLIDDLENVVDIKEVVSLLTP
jgi:aconitate decarboxylase